MPVRSRCSWGAQSLGFQRCACLRCNRSKASSTTRRAARSATPRDSGALPLVRDRNRRHDMLLFDELHVVQHGTTFHASLQYPVGMPSSATTG